MDLAQRLQSKRKEMGMTQGEIADQIHVSRQTISNWETGRTQPDINSLILISDIYKISLDSLIKEDTKMIKKLSFDSKQAENWFVSSCLISNTFSIFISTQGEGLEIRIMVLLLILETLFTGYISTSGYSFLKRNKEIIRKQINANPNSKIVDANTIVYAVTVFCGVVTLVAGILTIN